MPTSATRTSSDAPRGQSLAGIAGKAASRGFLRLARSSDGGPGDDMPTRTGIARPATPFLILRPQGVERRTKITGGLPPAGEESQDEPSGRRSADAVALVPGDQVALHWIDLPNTLSRAQAAAAGRLMAAEVASEPPDHLHVAVGAVPDQGPTCIAIVTRQVMEGWMAALQGSGFDPEVILPVTLLLPPPTEGLVRYDFEGLAYCRGPREAFALEPNLAELIVSERPVTRIWDDAFELAVEQQIARPLLNLRQGPFAKRRRIAPEKGFLRRNLLIAAAIVIVSVGTELAAIASESRLADSLDARTRQRAAAALADDTPVTDPPAQLRQRLADLGGGRAGLTAGAAALFQAVKETPNVELTSLAFESGAGMTATATADLPAALDAVRARLEAGGFEASGSAPTQAGAEAAAQWVIKPR